MSPKDVAFIEVNIEGLADAFGVIFREHIVPDNDRFRFWLENLDKIERTIYVRTIVTVLEECVKEGDLSRVDDSFAVCEFVLSHPRRRSNRRIPGKRLVSWELPLAQCSTSCWRLRRNLCQSGERLTANGQGEACQTTRNALPPIRLEAGQ